MIKVIAGLNFIKSAELVKAALIRSIGDLSIDIVVSLMLTDDYKCIVFINPDYNEGLIIKSLIQSSVNQKIIIFGNIPDSLLYYLNFSRVDWSTNFASNCECEPAPINDTSQSKAMIKYTELSSIFNANKWSRYFKRYDFGNEWNNMGYGFITNNNDKWSLSAPLRNSLPVDLAEVDIDDNHRMSYSSLFDFDDSSLLWFNREVGVIDSYEWHIVEQFLANHRCNDLPCFAIIHEVPWGFDSCITMRLDCDEDIESSRYLFELYDSFSIPFSLAITTSNLSDINNHKMLNDVYCKNGSILSHSHTHPNNWGGDYLSALEQANVSSKKIREVTGNSPNFAVSPFHHTPSYALKALTDSGYLGCIGGISTFDPEFLMAKGGITHSLTKSFVGHSQQHMLHGDCLLQDNNGLNTYFESYQLALASNRIYGYLDHPFSERYSYGWKNEQVRMNAHSDLIMHIIETTKKPLFLSEDSVMNFLLSKAKIHVEYKSDEIKFKKSSSDSSSSKYSFRVEYKNSSYRLEKYLSLPI